MNKRQRKKDSRYTFTVGRFTETCTERDAKFILRFAGKTLRYTRDIVIEIKTPDGGVL